MSGFDPGGEEYEKLSDRNVELNEKLTAALELLEKVETHLDKHKGYSMPVNTTVKLLTKIREFRGRE